MSEYINKCYFFIKRITDFLAKDYETQFQQMEEFVRWNLPEEIALEWIDAGGIIDKLDENGIISQKAIEKLRDISDRFIMEFEKSNSTVWTHEEMKEGEFWNTQRAIANEILEIL